MFQLPCSPPPQRSFSSWEKTQEVILLLPQVPLCSGKVGKKICQRILIVPVSTWLLVFNGHCDVPKRPLKIERNLTCVCLNEGYFLGMFTLDFYFQKKATLRSFNEKRRIVEQPGAKVNFVIQTLDLPTDGWQSPLKPSFKACWPRVGFSLPPACSLTVQDSLCLMQRSWNPNSCKHLKGINQLDSSPLTESYG